MNYTSDQIEAIDQAFKDKLMSNNSEMVKEAGLLSGTQYFRTRIRQNSVYRKLLPPKPVTADDFSENEFSDLPSMIVELDINSEGANQVPFETGTVGATFNGRKARCEFGRIMTPKYQIDKIRLTGYKMPILDILYDLMLKDIMDVEDESWTTLNESIVGEADEQTDQVNEFGMRRCIRQTWDRLGVAKIHEGMLRTKGKLKPSKGLMNELLYNRMIEWDRNEVGGDMAQDMLFDGVKTGTINKLEVLVTSKDEVCKEHDMWIFTDPEFYGASYTYEDVKMVTDEKDDIFLTFFAHETIGGIVANRAGICKITFDGSNTDADKACTDWLQPIV